MADSIQFRRGLRSTVKPLPVGMPGFIEDEERLLIGKGDGTNAEVPNKADMDNINSQMAYMMNSAYGGRKKLKDTIGMMQAGSGDSSILSNYFSFGFKYFRTSIVWADIEKNKGVYDDAAMQGYLDNCDRYISQGLTPLILLVYGNTLYTDDIYSGLTTEEAKEAFANFCGYCASKLSGIGVHWLIWNEPNARNFWSTANSAKNYTEAVKLASISIRSNDATALICAPELTGVYYKQQNNYPQLDWLKDCFDNGLLDYIDKLSIHIYRKNFPESFIDEYMNSLQSLKALISQYTTKIIPIIITECGGSTYSSGITEQQQADGIVRMYLISHAYGIDLTSCYEFKDEGTDITAPEQNFGIVKYDGLTLKQSGMALKSLISILGNYYFLKELNLTINDYCYVYQDDDNNLIYVFWTTIDPHNIILKGNYNGTLYSQIGTETNIEGTDIAINISQSPQYLKILNKKKYDYISRDEVAKMINGAIGTAKTIPYILLDQTKIAQNNLIQNSDTGLLDGWTYNPSYSSIVKAAYYGHNAFLTDCSSLDSSQFHDVSQIVNNIKPNTNYIVHLKLNNKCTIYAIEEQADGTAINNPTNNVHGFTPKINNMFEDFEFKFKTQNDTGRIYVVFRTFGSNISMMTLPQLLEGDKSLDWTPNLKDYSLKSTNYPTSGTWDKGTILYNSNPSSGGNIGWVCTIAGAPGTWKEFGTIQS